MPGKPGDLVMFEAYDTQDKLVTLGIGAVERVTVQGALSIMCDGRWVGAFSPDYCATRFDAASLHTTAQRLGMKQVSRNLYRARHGGAPMKKKEG